MFEPRQREISTVMRTAVVAGVVVAILVAWATWPTSPTKKTSRTDAPITISRAPSIVPV